jgi:hypothetical protein
LPNTQKWGETTSILLLYNPPPHTIKPVNISSTSITPLPQKQFWYGHDCHVFATSYGKGACEWLKGTTERLARETSLQNPEAAYHDTTALWVCWWKYSLCQLWVLHCSRSQHRGHAQRE